jgi:hypothetical protein
LYMIKNSVPAHTLYGEPQTGSRLAVAQTGSRIRGDKCTANDDSCGANKVRGQELCAGHLRKHNKEKGE